MKQFIYKTIIIIIAVIVLFEFTIGNKISQIYEKVDVISTKEGRKDSVNKIRDEMKRAVEKERYLSKEDAKLAARAFSGLEGMDLAKVVSTKSDYIWTKGTWPLNNISKDSHQVVAYDFGIKENILRLLNEHVGEVKVVNAETPYEEIIKLSPKGIFLSNGPGDPEPCDYAIKNIKRFLIDKVPIFGICLGHQLLSLAGGANTYKMKFGHHGANHPVQDIESKEVFITSQNHGFAVDAETLPKNIKITHISLFDKSLQGIEFIDTPAFSFQGHPEASPGPQEIQNLFKKFSLMVKEYAKT